MDRLVRRDGSEVAAVRLPRPLHIPGLVFGGETREQAERRDRRQAEEEAACREAEARARAWQLRGWWE